MTRTIERETFLADLIVTAVEGGTGYWAQVSDYHWSDEAPATTRATLHDTEDSEGPYDLTIETIARAFGSLERMTMAPDERGDDALHTDKGFRAYVSESRRKHLLAASRANDAGELDADDADVIAQIACFGRVVYG